METNTQEELYRQSQKEYTDALNNPEHSEYKKVKELATSFQLLSTEFLLHYKKKKETFNKPLSDYRKEALDKELELMKNFYEESADFLDSIMIWAVEVDFSRLVQDTWKKDIEHIEELFLSELSESTIKEIYDLKEIQKRLETIEKFGYEQKKQTFHR